MESFWSMDTFWSIETLWVSVGFLAQGIFASRFIIQWMASERAGHSVVPIGFWILSLFGGVLLFAYAVYRGDPVFILGQGSGLFVYIRNLYMIGRDRRKENRKTFGIADFFKQ